MSGIKAIISLKLSNEEYYAIELDYGGQPARVIPLLLNHYQNINKIKRLMDLGDLADLGPELGNKIEQDLSSANRRIISKKQCISWERDMDVERNNRHRFDNRDKLLEYVDANGAEYFYIYLSDYHRWFWAPSGNAYDIPKLLSSLPRETVMEQKSLNLKDILNEVLQEMPQITRSDKNVMAGEQSLKQVPVETVDENIVIIRESREGGFIPFGWTLVYFMDSKESAQEMGNSKIPYLLIPRGTFSHGGSPITDVWKKRFQKPGHEHILGLAEANSTDNEIFLDMVSVRPGYRRNTVASKMVEKLKKHFPNAKITHSSSTDQGEKFLKAKGMYKKEIDEGWHDTAKLQAYTNGKEFLFFRNGLPAGQILDVNNKGYIIGFGVRRDLQGTGLGKSMLQYVFEKRPDLEKVSLDSSANAFYHKIGGQRKKRTSEIFMRGFTAPKRQGSKYFEIPKERMTPSPYHFEDVDRDAAKQMWKKQKFDSHPAIN